MWIYQAGTSYRDIVSEVRMELAREYLRSTDLTMQEIAYLLGYEHAPSFFQAFKRQFGHTPTELRREQRRARE